MPINVLVEKLRGFFAGFSLSLKLSERHRLTAGKSLVVDFSSLGGRDETEMLALRELRFFFTGGSLLSFPMLLLLEA